MDEVKKQLGIIKAASGSLALLAEQTRNQVLRHLAQNLRQCWQEIVTANQLDLTAMDSNEPNYDRLLLSQERIYAIANDVETVASLPPSLGNLLVEKCMANGLRMQKISVPLGVVAVIYESRPNVTIDVFTLCFKTGNACVLKGGKEAYHSNRILVSLIQQALHSFAINEQVVYLLPPAREALHTLLTATNLIDVCIPRGSKSLINFVREHAKIPVIETGAGIVHTYFDLSGDEEKGRLIINNAKTRRVSVCNALDTLLIHTQCLIKLGILVELLAASQVEIFADEPSYNSLQGLYPEHLLFPASPTDFGCEFLAYKMAIKTVSSVDDAVEHIIHYTSGHSEAIIAENEPTINYFLSRVDAAVVYVNASTAFTDGGQFGMGAEIGISTQKLHARGPMSLEALTSYKWVVYGNGQIRQ